MQHVTAKPFPTDGAPLEATAGSYKVMLIPTIDHGYTLRVMAGAHEVTELAQQFTDETMARAVARQLTAGLRAGISIHQFIGDRKAAERGLVEAVNATMDAATDRYLAPRRNARQVAAETVNGDGPAWRAQVRRNAREIVWARQTKPTPTGAARDLSVPQLYALTRADRDGVIRPQPGVTRATLTSLARKGLGQLTLGGRTPYTVAGLTLNPAGAKAAQAVAA